MADAEEPLYMVISLAILANFVKSGLKSSFMESLMDKIFDNYGYKGTQVIIKLRKAGLLFVRDSNDREGTNQSDIGEFQLKKDELDLLLDDNCSSQDVKYFIFSNF
jgi:hypothetical protein